MMRKSGNRNVVGVVGRVGVCFEVALVLFYLEEIFGSHGKVRFQ